MAQYAAKTEVPVEKSRMEIERAITRYGATEFASGWRANAAVIGFVLADRQIRFTLPLPLLDDFRSRAVWEQLCRQRWRALLLVIKGKLEAVESGITTVENEFMANIVMPNGQTMGEWAKPQLALAYKAGKMPPLLPGPSS